MLIWLVIAVRVLANPLSNVFQKVLTRKSADPLVIICLTHGILSAACLPWFVRGLPPLPVAFWPNILLVAVLAVAGNVMIVQALRLSDLSVLGPINAYKAVVSLVPAMLLLGEFPGAQGVLGMALIIAGSYFLVDRDLTRPRGNAFVRFFRDRGIQYRFAGLVLSAVEAVFLKRAVVLSSPGVTFAFWCVLGFVAAAVGVMAAARMGLKLGREWNVARSAWRTYTALAVTTGLMQFCTLVAFGGMKVGYALALFQTSALVSVLLGYKVFRERNVVERLTGSAVMVAGAVLIVLDR